MRKDFVAVARVAKSRNVLVVHPSVSAKTVKEFIALARSKPGELNFASSGIGTTPHLAGEGFKQATGVNMMHMPYKESGTATTDWLAGRVHLSLPIPITVIPFIRGGKMRALAVSGDTRLLALKEVPTFAEAGLPG